MQSSEQRFQRDFELQKFNERVPFFCGDLSDLHSRFSYPFPIAFATVSPIAAGVSTT